MKPHRSCPIFSQKPGKNPCKNEEYSKFKMFSSVGAVFTLLSQIGYNVDGF